MSDKNDDYGYFGKGIDGYVHYKQAFDRNFENEQTSSTTSHSNNVAHKVNTQSTLKRQNQTSTSVSTRTYKPLPQRTPKDIKKTERLKAENPYNHPRSKQSQNKQSSQSNNIKNSSNYAFLWLVVCGFGALCLITLVPTLLGYALTGSASGADSFGGIFILVVGAILIALL